MATPINAALYARAGLPTPPTPVSTTERKNVVPVIRQAKQEDIVSETNKSNVPFNNTAMSVENLKTYNKLADFAVPNVLDDYELPTYLITFSLLSDVDGAGEIIIAESGQTSLNITNLNIKQYVGPSFRNRNTQATALSLEIFEPSGANLPDRMIQAARALDVKNYHKARWKVSVRFIGTTETGKKTNIQGSDSWSWPVMIQDLKSQINETGSSHVLTLMPVDEMAFTNHYFILQEMFSPKGNTVGEIVEELISSMNRSVLLKVGYPLTRWEITADDYTNVVNGISNPFDHKINRTKFDSTRNKEGAHFSHGTDLGAVIDTLMANSDTAVAMATLSRNPTDTGTSTQVFSVFHKILAKVEYAGFDPLTNDYYRTIKLRIVPYDTMRVIASYKDTANFENDYYNLRKANFALENGYLAKQYDYLFTGQNTSIQKFDINTNFLWAVNAALFNGEVHYGTSTTGRQYNEEARNKLQENKQKLLGLLDAEKEIRKQMKAGASNQAALDANLSQQQNIFRENIETTARIREDENATNVVTTSDGYAEDLNIDVTSRNSQILPMTIVQDADDPRNNTRSFIETKANNGISVYGVMLNQLYGRFDGNLQNIELEIRGDPYWLGLPYSKEWKETRSSKRYLPNFNKGEHVFVFRYRIPQGYNEETGVVRLTANDLYSGFYACISVEHTFSNGAFKQVLTGQRIPGWTLGNILEDNR